MILLLMATWAAGAVHAPSQVTITKEQAAAMALAPIDAAPRIAAADAIVGCGELWDQYFECIFNGRDDCRLPKCDD